VHGGDPYRMAEMRVSIALTAGLAVEEVLRLLPGGGANDDGGIPFEGETPPGGVPSGPGAGAGLDGEGEDGMLLLELSLLRCATMKQRGEGGDARGGPAITSPCWPA
jgi:hypothetical protein